MTVICVDGHRRSAYLKSAFWDPEPHRAHARRKRYAASNVRKATLLNEKNEDPERLSASLGLAGSITGDIAGEMSVFVPLERDLDWKVLTHEAEARHWTLLRRDVGRTGESSRDLQYCRGMKSGGRELVRGVGQGTAKPSWCCCTKGATRWKLTSPARSCMAGCIYPGSANFSIVGAAGAACC